MFLQPAHVGFAWIFILPISVFFFFLGGGGEGIGGVVVVIVIDSCVKRNHFQSLFVIKYIERCTKMRV